MTQAERPSPEAVAEARERLAEEVRIHDGMVQDGELLLIDDLRTLLADHAALEVALDVREAEVKELRRHLAQEPDWKQRALDERMARVALEAREKEAVRLMTPLIAPWLVERDPEEWLADIQVLPLKVKDLRALATFVNRKGV